MGVNMVVEKFFEVPVVGAANSDARRGQAGKGVKWAGECTAAVARTEL